MVTFRVGRRVGRLLPAFCIHFVFLFGVVVFVSSGFSLFLDPIKSVAFPLSSSSVLLYSGLSDLQRRWMDLRPSIRGFVDSPGEAGAATSMMAFSVPKVVAISLNRASGWWEGAENSVLFQDWIFHTLAALYCIVAAVALIQLIRIECRVPEYGWTTQKVFHSLNFLVNGVRSVVFVFRRDVQHIRPEVFQHVVLDLPGLAFFTTYTLLVLFWAEIYYQARAVSTDKLRPTFYTINAVVYTIQIAFWLLFWWKPVDPVVILSKLFLAGVSLFAALGFLLYGGRLFLMLQRFPVESRGRRKKLQEVGYVATICFLCFLVRCIMMCLNAFDKDADLDVLDHPILNLMYYLLVEILPSSLVLFILRKLPPKRGVTQYHPIH